jgi:hypothetical protein
VHQLVDSAAGFAWSFVVTLLILASMNLIPVLRLRVKPEVEKIGVDLSELGASAYEFHEELRTQLTNQIQFGNLWHRSADMNQRTVPVINRSSDGNGRKFDYASQVDHFCRGVKYHN